VAEEEAMILMFVEKDIEKNPMADLTVVTLLQFVAVGFCSQIHSP
jgi:hypothetical protein